MKSSLLKTNIIKIKKITLIKKNVYKCWLIEYFICKQKNRELGKDSKEQSKKRGNYLKSKKKKEKGINNVNTINLD